MKIAIFSDCFLDLTGGIVTTISAQKEELERRGHTVLVFSSAYPKSAAEKAELKKHNIFPVKSSRIVFRGVTPIARRPGVIERQILREHPEIKDYDVFYIHYEAGCSIAGLRLGKKLGIKTIQVMHGREDIGEKNLIPLGLRTFVAACLNWFHSWYLPHPINIKKDDYLAPTLAAAKMWSLMANHANSADLVLTPSAHFKSKLIKYGVSRPLKVLPNGVPDAMFVSNLPLRSFNPKSGEKLKLIWHSRVSGEKRIMAFLEALTYLNNSDYEVRVYGGGNDLPRAQRFIKRHNLNVRFYGSASFDKIYSKILESHLDVLTSYNYDTFGMTLIEAESAGTPALFVDPDLKEVVPASGSILTNSPSSTSIAEALKDVLDHPEKIAVMSREMLNGRDEVRVSKVVDKLEKYINELKM